MKGLLLVIVIIIVGSYIVLSQQADAQNTSSQHNIIRQPTIAPTNNMLIYENPSHTLKIQYPYDWKTVSSDDKSFKFISPGMFSANLSIDILPSDISLIQLVGTDIISYKQNLTAFKLIDSTGSTVAGNPHIKWYIRIEMATIYLK
jgi:hypothetical protein